MPVFQVWLKAEEASRLFEYAAQAGETAEDSIQRFVRERLALKREKPT